MIGPFSPPPCVAYEVCIFTRRKTLRLEPLPFPPPRFRYSAVKVSSSPFGSPRRHGPELIPYFILHSCVVRSPFSPLLTSGNIIKRSLPFFFVKSQEELNPPFPFSPTPCYAHPLNVELTPPEDCVNWFDFSPPFFNQCTVLVPETLAGIGVLLFLPVAERRTPYPPLCASGPVDPFPPPPPDIGSGSNRPLNLRHYVIPPSPLFFPRDKGHLFSSSFSFPRETNPLPSSPIKPFVRNFPIIYLTDGKGKWEELLIFFPPFKMRQCCPLLRLSLTPPPFFLSFQELKARPLPRYGRYA